MNFARFDPRRVLACTVWSVLLIAAFVLLWRRLAGAMVVSVPAAAIWTAILATWGLSLAALRVVQRRTGEGHLDRRRWILAAAAMLPAALTTLALTAGAPPAAASGAVVLFLAALALVVAETHGGGIRFAGGVAFSREKARPHDLAAESGVSADGAVLQRMLRCTDGEGGERIEGSLVAEFGPGQRTTAVHVLFAPPLPTAPQAECAIGGEAPAEVKVAERRPWGLRLEVRRRGDIDFGEAIVVHYCARSGPAG